MQQPITSINILNFKEKYLNIENPYFKEVENNYKHFKLKDIIYLLLNYILELILWSIFIVMAFTLV